MRLGKVIAGAAAFLLLAGSASAQVPDPFARELARQLTRAEELTSAQGFSRAAGPFAGGIGQGQIRSFPVTLRAGQEYSVVGVCDTHCNDLDLRLYDSNNVLIAQDILRDDVPVIQVRARTTGVHNIDVIMAQCGMANCYFAFNVYSR